MIAPRAGRQGEGLTVKSCHIDRLCESSLLVVDWCCWVKCGCGWDGMGFVKGELGE